MRYLNAFRIITVIIRYCPLDKQFKVKTDLIFHKTKTKNRTEMTKHLQSTRLKKQQQAATLPLDKKTHRSPRNKGFRLHLSNKRPS